MPQFCCILLTGKYILQLWTIMKEEKRGAAVVWDVSALGPFSLFLPLPVLAHDAPSSESAAT
jgi:hypothetical protein